MARQIVYRFNGDASTESTETDLDDSIPVPATGSHYQMNGKMWLVARVLPEQSLSAR
jgi:hypothetical protein